MCKTSAMAHITVPDMQTAAPPAALTIPQPHKALQVCLVLLSLPWLFQHLHATPQPPEQLLPQRRQRQWAAGEHCQRQLHLVAVAHNIVVKTPIYQCICWVPLCPGPR